MSLLTRTYPTKEWFHLFHARKDFRRAFAGKAKTLGLPCRLVYGYLAMRIKNKPRPTSKRQIAAAFGLNMARLNVLLDLLRQRGLVAQVGNDWYAAQPAEEAMAVWFVEKVKTEAETWHGRLAGVPVLLRSGKTGVSNLDVAVLSLVYNFEEQKVQKYRGLKSLANFLGSTNRTIAKSLGRLAKKGFLKLNEGKTKVAWLTRSPSEEQLAFFKDRRNVKQPVAQVLAEAVKVDQLLEGVNFDPTPPQVKARLAAKKRLVARGFSPVAVSQLLDGTDADVILRVDQAEESPLERKEFQRRCQEAAGPRVTRVEITEDRSDSLIPMAHLGTRKLLLADGGDFDVLSLCESDFAAPLAADPTSPPLRNPNAPQLTADDRESLNGLLNALTNKAVAEEPAGDMTWLLNG